MANININRNNPDQFYRYKMPRIIAKVEGKGNGIKTVIVNMHDVAKALERPATYPTKFFGCELGAQTQFDIKNDRYIVNGSHDAAKLQDLLDGFIKRFVLCPECDNPETKLSVQAKKGVILQRCIACGNQNNLDMRHKLTTFILKNPPGSELVGNTSATPNKKDKRSKRGSKSKESDAVNENGDGSRSPEVTEHDHDLDLIEAEDTAVKNGKNKANDDDWGDDIDVSDAAIQQRMEALSSAAKNLALTDDVEKTPQQRMDLFYQFVKSKKETDTVATSGAELLAEADRLDVKEKAPIILAELLFDENILTQIKTYRKILLRFTNENPKAQKYLLGGFEQLVGNVHKEVLLPKVPHILKLFYDLDILDEEVIIDWDKKVSKKYVSKEVSKEIHDKAAKLIQWLKEADEEESSSEEEEVEVVYSTTKKVGVETVKPAPTAAAVEEEDDLDIDAI